MTDLNEQINKLQAQVKAKQLEWNHDRKRIGISPDKRIAIVRQLNALYERLDVLLRQRDDDTEPPF